ncbi:MAG: hypothetical protein RBT46_06170 [Weeksellaceae bacterium]|nr:hypothetical protein [Weeksellaceae bacterium]
MELLSECIQKEILATYSEIYYLNSTKIIDEKKWNQLIENEQLSSVLMKIEESENQDILDFFLMKNEKQSDLYVIFSPLDLWEDEFIFKIHENVQIDWKSIPTAEKIK